MKILTNDEIISMRIEPYQCYEWVSIMLKNKNGAIMPAKTSIKPTKERFYNVMPSLIPQYGIGGVKVITRYPERRPSLNSQIMLFDYSSGNIIAFMDGNFITTMRTGAVAAHTIKLFAKDNFKTIGIIGLGNQARATLKVLLCLFKNKKLILKLFKYKNQHELFKDYISNLTYSDNIEIVFCDSYKDTVKGSDVVISSVTYFEKDICDDDCFDEGCLVVPIHTRGFMNCDLFFDKVYADDTNHIKDFKFFDKFRKFSEVSDVLNNKAEGRKNNSERIIVYNIGLSIHDVYFAEKIYEMAKVKDVGKEISLKSPQDKFWI